MVCISFLKAAVLPVRAGSCMETMSTNEHLRPAEAGAVAARAVVAACPEQCLGQRRRAVVLRTPRCLSNCSEAAVAPGCGRPRLQPAPAPVASRTPRPDPQLQSAWPPPCLCAATPRHETTSSERELALSYMHYMCRHHSEGCPCTAACCWEWRSSCGGSGDAHERRSWCSGCT